MTPSLATLLAVLALLAAAPGRLLAFDPSIPDIKGEMKRHEAAKEKARLKEEKRHSPCDPSQPACRCPGKSVRARIFKKATTDFTNEIETYADIVLGIHKLKFDRLLAGTVTDHEVDSANTLCEMVWKGLTKDAALRERAGADKYKVTPTGVDTGTVWVFLAQVGRGFKGVSEGTDVAGKMFSGLSMCDQIDVSLPKGIKVVVIDYNPEKRCPNALVHEIGHAVGLDDIYGLDVKNIMVSRACPKMPTSASVSDDIHRLSSEQVAAFCKSGFAHDRQSPDDYPAP